VKKTKQGTFNFNISTDGLYCSIYERKEFDENDCMTLKKVKELGNHFVFNIYSLSHVLLLGEKKEKEGDKPRGRGGGRRGSQRDGG